MNLKVCVLSCRLLDTTSIDSGRKFRQRCPLDGCGPLSKHSIPIGRWSACLFASLLDLIRVLLNKKKADGVQRSQRTKSADAAE